MKPDWAQGPEWDGWVFAKYHGSRMVLGWPNIMAIVDVYSEGVRLHISAKNDDYLFKGMKSPEAARKAAEALLEAME